jgi:hypothetical protein
MDTNRCSSGFPARDLCCRNCAASEHCLLLVSCEVAKGNAQVRSSAGEPRTGVPGCSATDVFFATDWYGFSRIIAGWMLGFVLNHEWTRIDAARAFQPEICAAAASLCSMRMTLQNCLMRGDNNKLCALRVLCGQKKRLTQPLPAAVPLFAAAIFQQFSRWLFSPPFWLLFSLLFWARRSWLQVGRLFSFSVPLGWLYQPAGCR